MVVGYGSQGIAGVATLCTNVDLAVFPNNIGVPLRNTSAVIIADTPTATVNILPRGALGELCFGGTQIVSIMDSLYYMGKKTNLHI